jgi:hypothetical protein
MAECKGGCGKTITSDDPALYDVLNPNADPETPETHGPYCQECFLGTVTGSQIAAQSEQ